MTSFSNSPVERGLDAMLIVYSLLTVEWETANLPAKGLPRVLRQIYQWLGRTSPQTAQDFWSQIGGGSHLP